MHTSHRNERLTVVLGASNKRRHSCPGHRCFEKFISYQLGLRRPTLPKLCHLLTKLRQRQRTSLAIIRCFLDFSSPHTPAFTPSFHHPAAATPTEWQSAPATRVTLLLPGGLSSRPRVSEIHRQNWFQGGLTRLPLSRNGECSKEE